MKTKLEYTVRAGRNWESLALKHIINRFRQLEERIVLAPWRGNGGDRPTRIGIFRKMESPRIVNINTRSTPTQVSAAREKARHMQEQHDKRALDMAIVRIPGGGWKARDCRDQCARDYSGRTDYEREFSTWDD